jgi:hypothetical protein
MLYDTVIKVGSKTVAIKASSHRGDVEKSQPQVTAKVVAPPEKKAPRKSTGAQHKTVD